MTDLIKAILIGLALFCAVLIVPVMLAVMVPLLSFLVIVGVVWAAIKLANHETPDDPDT